MHKTKTKQKQKISRTKNNITEEQIAKKSKCVLIINMNINFCKLFACN